MWGDLEHRMFKKTTFSNKGEIDTGGGKNLLQKMEVGLFLAPVIFILK